jgi:hypothetical protein
MKPHVFPPSSKINKNKSRFHFLRRYNERTARAAQKKPTKTTMTSHENLSSASKVFGDIATTQNNAAAAAMAIHLAIAASEAYAAELEQRQAIAAAVADSVATALPITVTLPSLDAIDAAVGFLKQRYADVDYDRIGCSVTIFGDDQRIEGDEDEGLWVLNLVIAPVPFVDTNAI